MTNSSEDKRLDLLKSSVVCICYRVCSVGRHFKDYICTLDNNTDTPTNPAHAQYRQNVSMITFAYFTTYFVSTLFLRLARCVYVNISYFIVFKVVQILFQITIEICSLNI